MREAGLTVNVHGRSRRKRLTMGVVAPASYIIQESSLIDELVKT